MTDLTSLATRRIDLIVNTPDELQTGNAFTFTATTELPGTAALRDTASRSPIVRCSYDPNDKRAFPLIEDPDGRRYTLRDSTLTYVIRFENTGNDYAETVRIEDQLPPSLDYSSFKPLGCSHDCAVTLTPGGHLTYLMEGINLLATKTDSTKSQGYVSFTIDLKPDINELDELSNFANIYFDRNAPVVTEPATSTIVSTLDADGDGYRIWEDCNDNVASINPGAPERYGNGIDENCDGIVKPPTGTSGPQLDRFLTVSPNPSSGVFELATQLRGNARVVNVYGQVVRSVVLRRGGRCDLSALPAGLYYLRVDGYAGARALVKL